MNYNWSRQIFKTNTFPGPKSVGEGLRNIFVCLFVNLLVPITTPPLVIPVLNPSADQLHVIVYTKDGLGGRSIVCHLVSFHFSWGSGQMERLGSLSYIEIRPALYQ